ncbi:hypothetical protein GCM10027596_17140 [Nocardioides korecus]
MPGLRSLTRHHDFTVLWIGTTISELGSHMSMFVFPLLGYALTGSTLTAAAAEAAHLLGLVACLLPAGVLADRVDRRRVMRASAGSGVLLYASLAAAGLSGHLTVPHLLVVALLTGVAAAFFGPSETAAVRAVVPAEDLPTALAQQQSRQFVAMVAGGPLGGALYAVARWLPFAVDAVTYAVARLLLGRLRTDLAAPERVGPRRRALAEVREGAAFIVGHRFLRVLTVWATMSNLVVNALFFAVVLRLVRSGVHPTTIGLVETVAGVAGVVGGLLAPRLVERLATGHLTLAVAWSLAVVGVPLALVDGPVVAAAALGSVLLLNPAGNAGIGAYRLAVTPPELVGRSTSCMQFVAMLLMPLAPVLGGGALAWLGGRGAMAALAVACGLVALVPTLSREVRSVPRPAVWRATTPAEAPQPGLRRSAA